MMVHGGQYATTSGTTSMHKLFVVNLDILVPVPEHINVLTLARELERFCLITLSALVLRLH